MPCEGFITESTFGLPIYRWESGDELARQINAWWAANAAAGLVSVLYCYAFGKAQRVLCGLDTGIGPIVVHGAVENVNRGYRAAGVALPPVLRVDEAQADKAALRRALVLAPPSARGTSWTRRFGDHVDGFASGWMQVRGARRRRGVDRGFVLSDHADWPGLQSAIGACGASRVIVTHGQVPVLVRWLNEVGISAQAFETAYGDEEDEGAGASESPEPPRESEEAQ